MRIGIDITPLQGPHRMRGIGYTLLNFINNLPVDARKSHEFVLYMLPVESTGVEDPITILDTAGLNYQLRHIQTSHVENTVPNHRQRLQRHLPSRVQRLSRGFKTQSKEMFERYFGNPHFKQLGDLDVFLQADPNKSLPRARGLKKVLIIYDIIPFVLEWDYLWSYNTARHIHGFSRKAAWRCQAHRWLYAKKLKINMRRANQLLSISEDTKKDLETCFRIPANKITVTPLGVSEPRTHDVDPTLHRYQKNSWGYQAKPFKLPADTPFLLFVGGADRRRKLQDLVTAFNHLRAEGTNIKLVLAGDSMKGPDEISTEEIQGALKTSSYLDDVIFTGFINDVERDWLYKHALAFVFPSRYEGFGLPVLEAMSYGCPVISYKNDATIEVGGKAPLYVLDAMDMYRGIKSLLDKPGLVTAMRKKGLAQVRQYNWGKTSAHIVSVLVS